MVTQLKSFPYCYKNQQLCDKSVGSYLHSSEIVPLCYKMCYKVVDTDSSTINFNSECFKTQERCYKAVNTRVFVREPIPSQCKTEKNISQNCFFISFFNSIFP